MEKVRQRRGILTIDQIYSDLKKTKSFIDSAKEPVRIWHLVTNSERGTVGFMSGPMLRILINNNILKSSNKSGYSWNSKIPVTYVLATKIKEAWDNKVALMNNPKAPCVAHASEPEIAKTIVVRKRSSKKPEGWLKRFFKWIW